MDLSGGDSGWRPASRLAGEERTRWERSSVRLGTGAVVVGILAICGWGLRPVDQPAVILVSTGLWVTLALLATLLHGAVLGGEFEEGGWLWRRPARLWYCLPILLVGLIGPTASAWHLESRRAAAEIVLFRTALGQIAALDRAAGFAVDGIDPQFDGGSARYRSGTDWFDLEALWPTEGAGAIVRWDGGAYTLHGAHVLLPEALQVTERLDWVAFVVDVNAPDGQRVEVRVVDARTAEVAGRATLVAGRRARASHLQPPPSVSPARLVHVVRGVLGR